MNNTKSSFSAVAVLSSVSLLLGMAPFAALDVYAESKGDSFSFEGVPSIIVETADSNEYIIEPDYTSFFDDIAGDQIINNKDAKDAKNLFLERGETVRISYSGERTFVASTAVFLVDEDEKDRDIVTGNVGGIIEIRFANCDVEDCQDFEAEVPSDIGEGKYKMVIDRDEDEGHYFYINKIRIT